MNNVVILLNKKQDFKVFLHCLPRSVKESTKFHLITDTRFYRPVYRDLGIMALDAGLNFEQYDGEEFVNHIGYTLGLKQWYFQYHRAVKISVPIIFNTLGKFLYIDDDVYIFNDLDPLFKYDVCSGRETVFARVTKEKDWGAYMQVWDGLMEWDQDYYNHNQLNSGVFMYTCHGDLALFKKYFKRYFTHPHFEERWGINPFIFDEEFLSFWFIWKGNEFVPSKLITTRNGPFAYRDIIHKTPCCFHYGCRDEYTPDYLDYYGNSIVIPGTIISGFSYKEAFEKRNIRTIPPSFKMDVRKRFRREK